MAEPPRSDGPTRSRYNRVMLLSELAAVAGFDVRRDAPFETPAFLSDAQPGMLVFIETERYVAAALRAAALAAVITTPELAPRFDGVPGLATAHHPRRAFYRVHEHLSASGFYWPPFDTEIHATARVHPAAWVAARNVRIGPHSTVEPHATILERSLIGARVTVRAGAVIGSAGFQTADLDGRLQELVHAGGVRLADDVCVFSNAVIASAVFHQFTDIGMQTRIGNAAFVSHNVSTGARCFVGHGSVVNGFTRLGNDVWIGPGATLANRIAVGDRAYITMGAVVIGDVQPDQHLTGNIAIEHRTLLRHIAALK